MRLSCLIGCGLLIQASLTSLTVQALTVVEAMDMSLDELLQVQVSTPGKREQGAGQAAAVVQVISAQQIQGYGARNLVDVLERATALYLTGSHFYPNNLTVIRGGLATHANNHTLLLLNGRPLRDSITSGEHFSFFQAFPLAAVRQIEIIRGPGSVLYGSNAYSGVINIITHDSVNMETGLTLAAGSNDHRAITLQAAADQPHWQGTAVVHHDEDNGWPFTATDFEEATRSIPYWQRNSSLLLQARRGDLSLQALLLEGQQAFWGAVTRWSGQPAPQHRDIESQRSMLDVGYRWQQGSDRYTDTHLTLTTMRFDHYNYSTWSNDGLLEATHHWQVADSARFLVGGTLWSQQGGSDPGVNPAPIADFSRFWSNLYAELQTNLSAATQVTLGIQLSKIESIPAASVPRFAFVNQLTPQWTVKFLHGEAYRAAYGLETEFNIRVMDDQGQVVGGLRGNPALRPETVNTSDLVFSYQRPGLESSLALFRSEQVDLITRERAADNVIDFINRDELTLQGVEWQWQQQFHAQGWWEVGYSFQEGRLGDGAPSPELVPDHLLKVGVIWQWGEVWQIGLFDTYASEAGDVQQLNPDRLAVNPAAKAHHLVTAQVSADVSRLLGFSDVAVELRLYGYNLLDEAIHHPEFVGRRVNTLPARPGRSVYAQLEMHW